MPAILGGAGRKLGKLVARFKARNEDNQDTDQNKDEDGAQHKTSEALPNENASCRNGPKSLLQYVSATWEDNESIADTNSTTTRVKLQALGAQESSSIHAKGDPSCTHNSRVNDAVQHIYSVPDFRSEPSLYYLDSGRLGSTNPRKRLHGLSHPYRYGSSRAQPVPGNTFPITEAVDPDWRLHALGRNRAGHWSMEDFSEQHLADRLFYNANIIAPVDHLAGSQRAAAQDLEAMHLNNQALKASSAKAEANANQLEEYVGTLRSKLREIDMEIDTLRTCLEGRKESVDESVKDV